MLQTLLIIGITVQAMTGALRAGREKMDLFGVIMIALVTSLGGGSIRDVLLAHYPLAWVKQPTYVLIVSVAAVITVSFAQLMKYLRQIFLLLDAIGLVVFSLLGAQIAMAMELGWITATISAVVTGVAGGMLRDMLCGRIPLVFHEELYASVAVLVSGIYLSMSHFDIARDLTILTAMTCGFIVRVLAIRFRIKLPVFDYEETYYDNRKAMWRMLRRMQRSGTSSASETDKDPEPPL